MRQVWPEVHKVPFPQRPPVLQRALYVRLLPVLLIIITMIIIIMMIIILILLLLLVFLQVWPEVHKVPFPQRPPVLQRALYLRLLPVLLSRARPTPEAAEDEDAWQEFREQSLYEVRWLRGGWKGRAKPASCFVLWVSCWMWHRVIGSDVAHDGSALS
jgi:hypothetical protein